MTISISTIAAVTVGGPVRVSVIGDSIAADGGTPGAGNQIFTNWGFTAWFRRFMGGRIDLPLSRVYAVPGAKISDMVATQLPLAAADNSDIVICHIGKNSIGVETDAAIQSEMQTTFDTLRAAGKIVIAIPTRAANAPNAWSAQQAKQVGKMARFIYQYCKTNAGMIYYSFDPQLIDWSTGNAQAIYLRDGIHDNAISAELLGKGLANFLSPFIPMQDARFTDLGDIYDATFNPTGNLLTNGLLAGAGGTLANGSTGTPPTGWRGFFGGAASTSTLAFSKVTDATYPTLTRAVMTLGGTGDANSATMDQQATIAALGISVGDVIEMEAEVSWNFTTGTFGAIYLELDCQNSGFTNLLSAFDGFPVSNGRFAAGDTGTAYYRTPPITVPATTNFVDPQIICTVPPSAACAGTVTIGRVALRKVV